MSSTRIALLGSVCLLATVSIANAGEIELSADQLDSVTGGAQSLIAGGASILTPDSGLCTFCPEPPPAPEPAPGPDSTPDLPSLDGLFGGGLFGGLFGGGLFGGSISDLIQNQIGSGLAGLN